MYSLKLSDFTRGLIVAVLTAVAMMIGSMMADNSFDVFNADWTAMVNKAVQSAAAAFVGYMAKNFFSDNRGAVLGRIASAGK